MKRMVEFMILILYCHKYTGFNGFLLFDLQQFVTTRKPLSSNILSYYIFYSLLEHNVQNITSNL